jgi:hypothetical protein
MKCNLRIPVMGNMLTLISSKTRLIVIKFLITLPSRKCLNLTAYLLNIKCSYKHTNSYDLYLNFCGVITNIIISCLNN